EVDGRGAGNEGRPTDDRLDRGRGALHCFKRDIQPVLFEVATGVGHHLRREGEGAQRQEGDHGDRGEFFWIRLRTSVVGGGFSAATRAGSGVGVVVIAAIGTGRQRQGTHGQQRRCQLCAVTSRAPRRYG